MRSYRALPEFYDAEYADHPMLRRDVPFLLEHLPRRRRDVLELAVGTARAAIPLAQAGHRVVGVDYDPAMLELARRKRDAVGLDDGQLRLVRQDVTRLKLAERFDWVVILFNTFLNFTTLRRQDALLARAAAHLRPGGRLWIDIFQPNLELLSRRRSVDLDPVIFYVPALDRTVFRATDIRCDLASQSQTVTFRYQWLGDDGQERRARLRFGLTFMFPRELQLLVERHGFALQRLFGDHDGSAPASDSPRLIALCRKNKG